MSDLLKNPGQPGVFGALLDETARATLEMCNLVETLTQEQFLEERQSADPDTVSLRSICAHCVRAAFGYSNAIRGAIDLARDESGFSESDLESPLEFRNHMRRALQHTEETVAPLQKLSDEEASQLTFAVSWGPTYDPEMLLEHGVVHVLRHRRQIERWI